MFSTKTISVILFTSAVLSCNAWSQGMRRAEQKDQTIDEAQRTTLIDTLKKSMSKKYVFPEVANKVNLMLSKHQKNGDYKNILSANTFAETLTKQLQELTHDKHLSVRFESEPIPEVLEGQLPTEVEQAKEKQEELSFMKSKNFGIEKIERLSGNVGYLDFRGFGNTEIVGNAIGAAMTLLNASDALIIDLRKNGGGSPSTVALLASYFLPPETHLNDIYNREENSTTQMWSVPHLAGPRYDKSKKVYVLTSHFTFSAAEDLSYTLQSLKRSTTIGEITGGGAHPVDAQRLSQHFMAFVPFGRSINPITKTNWEGVGVIPEMKTSADEALKVAHKEALQQLLTLEKHPGKKRDVEMALENLKK
ncbi:MAG: S41 family peptidase [Undibacterium sp.]|nr:S41 family peptidase [Undibacterium sp.]